MFIPLQVKVAILRSLKRLPYQFFSDSNAVATPKIPGATTVDEGAKRIRCAGGIASQVVVMPKLFTPKKPPDFAAKFMNLRNKPNYTPDFLVATPEASKATEK